MWQLVLYISFVVWLYYAVYGLVDQLMYVREWLLNIRFAIVVVLLCRDFTTEESRVKVRCQ